MNHKITNELLSIYQQTFNDLHFSCAEKKAVKKILSEYHLSDLEINILKFRS